ncbi:MAG: epoxyqueuosine reductase QueH [Actinobacteria bacterium]|nr:epoxyqueuosine reductase QueH [Actinomycetota bacterium]MBM3712118.1 epoxyqueuosine reductase QueH [Actinomycetota bacterium]
MALNKTEILNIAQSFKKKLLLHVCCANCVLHPINILIEKFDITMFYCNPNIHPEEEYLKRLADVEKVSHIKKIPLIKGDYKNELEKWFEITENLKEEPEGGRRCVECFRIRLEKTASYAVKNGFDIFTTTLSISPHKNQNIINELGRKISKETGISFFCADFKKLDGFKKTIQLSKELDMYRQNYCGCIYSKKK